MTDPIITYSETETKGRYVATVEGATGEGPILGETERGDASGVVHGIGMGVQLYCTS